MNIYVLLSVNFTMRCYIYLSATQGCQRLWLLIIGVKIHRTGVWEVWISKCEVVKHSHLWLSCIKAVSFADHTIFTANIHLITIYFTLHNKYIMSHSSCVRTLDFSNPAKKYSTSRNSCTSSSTTSWLTSTSTSAIPRPQTRRSSSTSLARRLSFKQEVPVRSTFGIIDSPVVCNWRMRARLRMVCSGASPGYVASTALWTIAIITGRTSNYIGSCQSRILFKEWTLKAFSLYLFVTFHD